MNTIDQPAMETSAPSRLAGMWLHLAIVTLAPSGPASAKSRTQARTPVPKMAIQFFGDLFIPERSLRLTESHANDPKLFAKLQPLLAASTINVANFEGAITPSLQPHTLKTYLLPMPASVAPLLKGVGIHGVTLANNHALDFGLPGMMATLDRLRKQGIPAAGAGMNLAAALRPMVFGSPHGNLCVFSASKTYPKEFWATPARFGTASPTIRQLTAAIHEVKPVCRHTFVVFHWGAEGRKSAKDYQRTLARKAIDAGAAAVIGHHPHVLQPIELYKGKPIFYSLGNFVFGTVPANSIPEGMAAGLSWRPSGQLELWLTPLRVDNKKVRFITSLFEPQHAAEGESDPVAPLVSAWNHCQKVLRPIIEGGAPVLRWRCRLPFAELKVGG